MSPLENTIDYRDKMSIKLCDHAHLGGVVPQRWVLINRRHCEDAAYLLLHVLIQVKRFRKS